MNFFKEDNNKGQIVPSFPTGNCGVEPSQDSLEAVHPGICPFDSPTFLVHLLVKKIFLRGVTAVSPVGTHIGYDLMAVKGLTEFLAVDMRERGRPYPCFG